ncbi:VOC family protein [Streptomyces capparidis]
MTPFYHVCFAVPDLDAAMADLTRSVCARWSPPLADRIGEWDYRITFTRGGPPFIELIEGSPGSPWDASQGARFDHLGYWTTSVEQGSRRLEREGFPTDFSGCPHGRPFAYHRVDSIGARVELVDLTRRPAFTDRWHPDDTPMPALPEE